MWKIASLLLIIGQIQAIPNGFSLLSKVDPTIIQSVRYFTEQNFIGRVMYGYVCNQLIMTNEAAQALKGVQSDLVSQGYSLVVYDSFRPQRTVDFFVDWANNITDLKMKEFYYPYLNGSKL